MERNVRRRVEAEEPPLLEPRTYELKRILGKGSYGHVYLAIVKETKEAVAIKMARMQASGEDGWTSGAQNGSHDREVQILKELRGHPNIVSLEGVFLSPAKDQQAQSPPQVHLNMVLEYCSDTLHRVLKHTMNVLRRTMDDRYVRLYQYQLLRGLAFIHGQGIMHCDIKPQNLLLDGKSHTLKIADFGTAKRLWVGRTLQSYVCSRYYRAPELILGSTNYNTSVDLWSAGCVLGEMLLGQPMFTGTDGIDQLVQIVKVLGTPSPEDLQKINHNFSAYNFQPRVAPLDWDIVFKRQAKREARDLVDKLLRYDPASRVPPLICLMDHFFRPLREMPDDEGKSFLTAAQRRVLFDFQPEELWWCSPEDMKRLVPEWMKAG
jgi:glycogen synthase kinase 3 beta